MLVLTYADDVSSERTKHLQWQHDLNGLTEAWYLEFQAKRGLDFLHQEALPCHNIIVIIQSVAQIFKALELDLVTTQCALLLAQTAVLDANSDGKDPAAARGRLADIISLKDILALSGSPLPLNLALMVALFYKA